jgi:hypothetical protein
MKTAKQWSEEMNGKTSPQIVVEIQRDAMVFASTVAKNALYEGSRYDEGRCAKRAILEAADSLDSETPNTDAKS